MIKYSLMCKAGHEFEGWFSSSEDYENQKERKLVTCPGCGSCEVSKTIMAPNVGSRSNRVPVSDVSAVGTGLNEDTLQKIRQLKKEIERKVTLKQALERLEKATITKN